MYQVYILKSETHNFHYIGSTSDMERRLEDHNNGKVTSSRPHSPLRLIYTESYDTNLQARKRELYLKSKWGNLSIRKKLINLGLW